MLSITSTGTCLFNHMTSSGTIKFTALPSSDPHVAGQLWTDVTTLKVSTG